MKLGVSYKMKNMLNRWGTISFSKMNLLLWFTLLLGHNLGYLCVSSSCISVTCQA